MRLRIPDRWKALVLIDTWWNVNEHGYTEPMKTVSVLIDTWWNVNVEDTINGCNDLIVLIDTWWNVNITHSSHRYLVSGFNRYMVECELSLFLYISDSFSRFNRYMVECEFFDIIKCTLTYTVLIDTWWNVNFFCKRIYGR